MSPHTRFVDVRPRHQRRIDAHDGHHDAVQSGERPCTSECSLAKCSLSFSPPLLQRRRFSHARQYNRLHREPHPRNRSASPQQAPTATHAVPAPAHPPSQQSKKPVSPVLRSLSDLVRIDVEVTDRSGKPIKGLEGRQVHVYDDGKSQKISIFSYEDIEAIETAAPDTNTKPIVVPSTRRPRRRFLRRSVGSSPRIAECWCCSSISLRCRPTIWSAPTTPRTNSSHQQMTPADLVAVVVVLHAAHRARRFHERSGRSFKKAVAQLTPTGDTVQLSRRPLCRGAETASTTYRNTPATPTPPTKPNSTSSTRTRNSQPSKDSSNVLGGDSRPQVDHRVHRRHHADGRGESHRIARRHGCCESRGRFHLLHRFARAFRCASGRRRDHRRRYRNFDVHRRVRVPSDRPARGFARHAGDAFDGHGRQSVFRSGRFERRVSRKFSRTTPATIWWATTSART